MDLKKLDDLEIEAGKVFTPGAPIREKDHFVGRADELKAIKLSLAKPGTHPIIYGDRGVGKSSLADIATQGENRLIYRCSKGESFEVIVGQILIDLGLGTVPTAEKKAHTEGGKAGVEIPLVASGGVASERTVEQEFKPLDAGTLTPNFIATRLGNHKKIIVLDEFERIEDEATRGKFAELIKKLSDSNSAAKVMIVGIGDTVEALLGQHRSLAGRGIAEVKVPRMSVAEIFGVLSSGSKRVGVGFSEDFIRALADYSDQLPYFAHLLGLSAVYAVVDRVREKPESVLTATMPDLEKTLFHAIKNSEQSLQDSFTRATDSVKESHWFKSILAICSLVDTPTIRTSEIQRGLAKILGRKVELINFMYHLGELVKPGRGCVLKKLRKGVYGFRDPMMKTYVRLVVARQDPLKEVTILNSRATKKLQDVQKMWGLEEPAPETSETPPT